MKKQNIIVINNLCTPDKAMAVKNFSDENVREAIGKLMDMNPAILKCSASSMSEGIYEVTTKVRSLKDEVKKIFDWQKADTIYIRVSYATLYE